MKVHLLHLAEKKVFDRLRRYVWWPGMRNDVHTFCRSCGLFLT